MDVCEKPHLEGFKGVGSGADNNLAFKTACRCGHLGVVKYLCETVGLNAEDARANDNEALRAACEYGRLEVLKYLCETVGLGAEDARAVDNWALRGACGRGHIEVVKYLCETVGLGAEEAGILDNCPHQIVNYFEHFRQWKRAIHWIGVGVSGSPWIPGNGFTDWALR